MEKEQHQFNLEFHLLEWKRGFSKTSVSKEDAEELAQHLRDHHAELIGEGHSDEQAWHLALQAIGSHRAIVKEFDKVWYMFLRNTSIYYLLILVPVGVIVYFTRNDLNSFVWPYFAYLFIYRTFIDFLRLRSRNAIDKNGYWKLLVPGAHMRYFRQLYFY